jgi:hypothetical protein
LWASSRQSARVGIGGLSCLDADPGVEDLRAVRPGDDRVQVEFGDLRQVVGDPGHLMSGAIALVTGSAAMLATLAVSTGGLWVMATARHTLVSGSRRPQRPVKTASAHS